MRVLVVGAGVMGLTAAVELRARGHDVEVLDAGAIPLEGAAAPAAPAARGMSHDTSRMVRPDYAEDDLYAELSLRAIEGWKRLDGGRHWRGTGVEFLLAAPPAPGSFEAVSAERLAGRFGARLEPFGRGPGERLAHPAFRGGGLEAAGYANPAAGWVDCGAAMRSLASRAARDGVRLRPLTAVAGVEVARDGRASGVRLEGGGRAGADLVVVAAGAWTPRLLPELADRLAASSHPLVYLRPRDPAAFAGMPAFSADITGTGFYGFPPAADGLIKVGHHGDALPGVDDPSAPRDGAVPEATVRELRRFLERRLPRLAAGCEVASTAACFYCDSFDGDFFAGAHPRVPGLAVAAGGSGHAFKFLPVLGPLLADLVLGGAGSPYAARWGWRAHDAARASAKDHIRASGSVRETLSRL